ncbi:hypothetical protein F5887DRAFT_968625 [Amanita rubescens]|nr:hypothetical protein F5887DRAFT_968625 [Amanita rubescens]
MPPKGASRKKGGTASDGSATPHLPSLAEQLSYMHLPRPFKNPAYNKNVNRRAKNMKAIISQEREREKAERERRRLLKAGGSQPSPPTRATPAEMGVNDAGAMDVDAAESEVVVKSEMDVDALKQEDEVPTYTSIDAPPSVWPPQHYCDITGLEAPYTDPGTGLRFHDKSIYQLIKGLSTSTAKDYLVARGVSMVVK